MINCFFCFFMAYQLFMDYLKPKLISDGMTLLKVMTGLKETCDEEFEINHLCNVTNKHNHSKMCSYLLHVQSVI